MVLPCTLVLAGGAGCTVRNSIGSSTFGFMLLKLSQPTKIGKRITIAIFRNFVPPLVASATLMIGRRKSCQASSVEDTHMKIPISVMVA